MACCYHYMAGVYDTLMYDVDYGSWAGYLGSLLQKHGVLRGARVLDAACGTGSISLLLKTAGYDVTASDRSEEMLNAAAQKFHTAGVSIPLIMQDMREISLHKKADAVVCTCDGVNYLLDDRDVAAFFKSAYAELKDGGVLLFDVSTEYKLKEVIANNIFCDETEDLAYIWKNDFDAGKCCMDISFYIREGQMFRRYTETHVQRAHRPENLAAALASAGFETVEIYGFGTENPPGQKTERIQFCAKKSKKDN